MEKLASFARLLGEVNAIWVENHPDQITGYVNTIKKATDPIVSIHVAKDPRETEGMMPELRPSALILDIRLDAPIDGITLAKSVRKRDPVIPIAFVTSYLEEYQERLKGVENVGGIYDRLMLHEERFLRFKKELVTDAYAYHIYSKFNLSQMQWNEFIHHPHRDFLTRAHSRLYSRVARAMMSKKDWSWVIVCGARVLTGGNSMVTFPTQEERLKLANQHGSVPFVYARPIISEEGGDSSALLNHYPKLGLRIGSTNKIADFDTGTNQTLVPSDMTEPDAGTIPESGIHLGERYEYFINQREVRLSSMDNPQDVIGPIQMPVAIVEDWRGSPWVRINPSRGALVGRDIFQMESLSVRIVSAPDRKAVTTNIDRINKGD